MSILKKKIARALEMRRATRQKGNTSPKKESFGTDSQKIKLRPRDPLKREILKAQLTIHSSKNGLTSCKNIVKNYSTAIISFALSNLMAQIFGPLSKKYEVELEEFRRFIRERKSQVNCIKGLRGLLLVEEGDSEHLVRMKQVFQDISIIFIKNYSVNWIFNSKISDKRRHLDYRFKMLRRVRNPIHFTYLEEFSK